MVRPCPSTERRRFPIPDALVFDATGTVSGVPGSVLVGGEDAANNRSLISVIRPDSSVVTLFSSPFSSAAFRNPQDLVFDRTGRLLFTNSDSQAHKVSVSTGGFPTTLFTIPVSVGVNSIAVDEADRIYTIGVDGVLRVHDSAGQLLNGSFAVGLGSESVLAFGTGGAFGTYLYVITNGGDLRRYDAAGSYALVGRGFQTARDLAFGPDGDLYVSEFAQDRILRIASPPSAGVIVKADDGRGGTATQSYTILVRPEPGNFPPAIVSQPSTSVLILPPPAGRNRLAITFEGIPAAPTFSQSNPIPPEARLSDRFLLTHGVTFRSASGVPHIAVVRLGAGHAHSGTNGIGGMSSATALSYVTPILAEFFLPNDPTTPAQTDFVSIKADTNGVNGTIFLDGYDIHGVLLQTTSAIDFNGPTLTLSTPGIHSVRIRGTTTTAFDDFSFQEVYPVQVYEYDVRALDPDDDTLVYSLAAAPDGMTIVSGTGEIEWYVPSANAGTRFVIVRVDDGRGGFDTQSFVVTPTTLPGEIRGGTFNDIDGDGAWDSGEPGLRDWIVYLDQDRNYRRGPAEPFAVTDANGNYAFANLIPATHIVREEPPSGWRLTTPASGAFEVTLVNGAVVPRIDFGSTQSHASNQPPAFSSTPLAAATVGQRYRYNSAVIDADLDPLHFDLLVGPGGMAIDPEAGVVVWTPAADQGRVHDVILRVQDGRGGVDLQSFQITVAASETDPVFSTSPPQVLAVVGQSYQSQFQAQDADTDPLRFGLDQAPAGMTLDPATGLLAWTPAADQLGTHTIIVTVSDDREGQDSVTLPFEVVAAAPNMPPAITSTPRTRIHLGGRYLYSVAASDANNDPIALTLSTAPAGMTLDPAMGLVEWEPTPDQLGNNAVEVRADDGRGGVTVQSYVVNVMTAMSNEPPRIVSAPVVTGTAEQPYVYDLRAEDPEYDPLVWSLIAAPRGMSIHPRLGTLRWIPAADQAGPADVVVLLTDGQGGRATQSFTIIVRGGNLPPTISSAPPTQGRVGQVYNYAVRAADADGDPLRYRLTTSPAGMTINAATGLIQWMPAVAQTGSHDVAVLVEDGRGGNVAQTFTLVVVLVPLNRPPIITSVPRFVASVGLPYVYDAAANDPEGDALTFELLTAPAGMSIDPATGVIHWTPVVSQVGTHSVSVRVKDASGNAAGTELRDERSAGQRAPHHQLHGSAVHHGRSSLSLRRERQRPRRQCTHLPADLRPGGYDHRRTGAGSPGSPSSTDVGHASGHGGSCRPLRRCRQPEL